MGRRVASVSHFHFLMSLGNAGWRDYGARSSGSQTLGRLMMTEGGPGNA